MGWRVRTSRAAHGCVLLGIRAAGDVCCWEHGQVAGGKHTCIHTAELGQNMVGLNGLHHKSSSKWRGVCERGRLVLHPEVHMDQSLQAGGSRECTFSTYDHDLHAQQHTGARTVAHMRMHMQAQVKQGCAWLEEAGL